MAISNVDDLYNELSSNENFSGLFANPEDFATALEGMSPERRDAFFEKLGASEQISKVDFDNVLKKKENSLSNLQLDGDNQPTKANTPQPKPSVPNQTQPQGNTQSNRIEPPRITLFPDEPAPGSPVKRKTLEERFPQTEEEKKKQKQLEAVQTVMKEQEKQKNVYTPPKKPTPEQVKQNIALQKQFDREQRNVSDMPTIKSIDYEAVAAGRQFVKQQDELASQKKAEEIKVAKDSDNSLFSGLQKGLYEYALPSGEKFQLDEYAIGRALFENQPIEIFSKSGVKVDVLDPTKDLLKGDNNFNVIDDQTIRDHFSRLGFSEEQSDEEILRLKQLYLQQGAKDASKNLYNQLLQKWNGNQALANQNYLNYWNNRGLDLLEGSEKEAYHIVKQMEAIRSKLIQEQKKGGLSAYNASTVQSYRKQLDDLQDQLSELRDNPNNLYDWRTGEFIDTRIKKGDPRVAEIQQENKEFQAKYGDKPKEALVKRRDELLSERAFIMNKMREFNLDIPEEGTWDSAVRALQLSAARLSGVNTITLPDGRTIDAKMYERKMRDYNSQLYSVMSELYGLNRAVMLNENVALRKESESFLGSVAKNLGIAAESVAREFTPGTTTEDANSEYNLRNSLLNSLEQSGYVIDPSLRSAASASVSETISGSAGMLLSSMAQIALGNIAVPEIMSLRWAKQFKDILSNKYGKLGAAVFENTANAMRSGAIFEAAGQGFSTGVGEYGAQAAFDLLNLDRILGSKGRLANFLYRSLIGGAGETFEEVAGQYIQGLTDAGFDPNKAFKDSFGVTPESRLDQLLVIGITSLGFSGASNLKLLTATRSTLNEILENPKLAAAYGEILTPEKKQQIEDVLKAVDDKLADKQSQQTNAEVTGTESSEYTPRVNGEDVQKQVALINEERKQALEQITPEGGVQTPEQKAEVEQKAAEINALYDERVNAVVPPQTKFDTLTGTNQNAVLGNIDLNSEQAQNFLASLPNARARRNAATLMAVANNANTTLESILPNAKVVLHSRESFRDKMSQVGEQADRKGNFSIIRNPDGSSDIEIQINVEDGNVMDIAHEVTHGVLFSKFYGDDKRMAEIAEIRANTDLTPEQINNQIKEVNNKYDNQFSETLNSFKEQLKDLVTEKGNKYLESFIANYDENAKAEEYLSEFTAILVKNGEQIRQEDPTFFERLLAMINRLVGVIGKEAGIKLQKFEDTQEVIDFFNTVVSSIRKGEALTETKIPKTDAVQKQTAGQVPVQPETRVGQEVEQGKPQAEPQGVTEEGQEEEIINKPRVAVPSIVQVFHGGSLETPRDNVFVATDPEQARAYAQGNQGRLYQFYVDKSTLAGESYVYRKIKELGLSSKEEGQNTDELGIQELLDNRFDTALPDEQIQQLQDKLKEEDFTGISFIDEDILQKQKLGVENYLIFNPDDLYNSEEQANNAIQLKSNKRDGKPNPKDFGSISEDRLSPASGESKLGSMGEDAAYYVQTFQSSEPEEPGERRESKALRQWAKENRVYINEKQLQKVIEKQNLRVLEPGAESDVYLGPESNYVYKISNGGWAKNWKEFFLRIIAHNELFSSTPYEILGFTEKDGDLGVLMKQPAIPFNKGLDQEEVHEYLKDLGFDQDKQKMWSLSGEDTRRGVVLEDLHSGNVVWNELTGEATMIDPFIFFTANSPYRQAIENTIEDNFGKEIINKARRPIEEVKKDLNEKLAKGQVDRVTLSLLEDYGKQLEEGKVIYDRFLEEENSGFVSGGHILAESTLLATRNAGVDESQDERVDRQEAEIEKYAKLKGIWIENTEDFLSEKYGEPIGSGQESIVFGTEKNTVVKTSNTNQYKASSSRMECYSRLM
ncbi:MAG: hypothetical protein EBR30_07395 [Cytophagia bacterium]|nr:hypothetical protein [Cytophagia bacterium]